MQEAQFLKYVLRPLSLFLLMKIMFRVEDIQVSGSLISEFWGGSKDKIENNALWTLSADTSVD